MRGTMLYGPRDVRSEEHPTRRSLSRRTIHEACPRRFYYTKDGRFWQNR